jgi:glycosyltransferase involved in cell wall biosynthesis
MSSMTCEIPILSPLPRHLPASVSAPPALSILRPLRAAEPSGPARKIAIIFQDFAAGGTERIMVRLANEWAKTREVRIFCGSRRGPALAALSEAVTVEETSPAISRSMVSRWRLGRKLEPMLQRWQPDIIVGPGNHVLPVILALGRTDAPVICKLSNPASPNRETRRSSGPLAWVRRRAFRPLAHIVAMSPALRDEAAAYLHTDKVRVISEPILAERPVAPRRPRSSITRILFAGRLVAQKNVALALRALAELPSGFALTIVGDGPDRGRLERLAGRLGLQGRVTFTGHLPDIAPYLASCDILLLPSRFEGYPAVLIEALARGVPVVTTPSSPAMGEILFHPSFGRIAAPDPIGIAAAITALQRAEGPDPAALEALLDRHRLDRSAADWLAFLDEVVASRAKPV